jgi:hypothetical protein
MRIAADDRFQLTYCTNVHPTGGWAEVAANLERYVPPLKARFAPDRPFGIGLRLSNVDSIDLLQDDNLTGFREWLASHGCYVSTMNGFPYGPFHETVVKENVHAPDWRHEERVDYTLRLITILAAILPDGEEGGISTSPLTYAGWVERNDRDAIETMTWNVLRIAEFLIRHRIATGQLIHLDIEPEPDGLLGNMAELIDYFEDWLLPLGIRSLSDRLSISLEAAQREILEHIRVCFDTCHVALGYEDPRLILDRFADIGIKVGKIQISSALDIDLPPAGRERIPVDVALEPFDEPTYLHQVIQRNVDGELVRYPDLPAALPFIQDEVAVEWRVHFHVPIFVERYATFGSTQQTILETLALVMERGFTDQLEIETYTWDVLPTAMKEDLGASIAREYEWVLNAIER